MANKNVYSWTSLISGYFSCGQVEEGRRLFNHMPVKNVVSWTTVLLGYARNSMIDEARHVFDLMPERNTVSWTVMIKAFVGNDQLVRHSISSIICRNVTYILGISCSQGVLHRMPNKDVAAWNAMITSYVHEGLMTEASELFYLMRERNIVTWNVMIGGYAKSGSRGEALKYVILMLRFCFRPNATTITSMLSSCEGMMELMQAHGLEWRCYLC
ncbi:pentatricopeptide repeat-containing protein [Prunus yedoensis var. nudiflora]|uniref:Pentatricopeptide repeat-containing protein n=1 Tax=Prunus yedoensis var. nudiflora TaxID=2094558 RepID=A0A314YLQ5_PRUYE|nr:pentatricopeptide repeat-containing protein [Prunus yedoensis var. nudiflora]